MLGVSPRRPQLQCAQRIGDTQLHRRCEVKYLLINVVGARRTFAFEDIRFGILHLLGAFLH